MLNLGGKCILVCIILLLCGYSFAATGKAPAKAPPKAPAKASTAKAPAKQIVPGFAAQMAAKKAEQARRDSLARLDSLAKIDSLIKAMETHKRDSIDRVVESDRQDSIAIAEAHRLDSIARMEVMRRDSIAAAARRDSIARVEAMARANGTPYPYYEAYLDSLEAYVRYLLPSINRLDSAKIAIRDEPLKAKSEYESQAAYEQRVANFDKNKQQRIENLENEYLEREKEKGIGRLLTAATLREDIQPDWGNLLQQNASEEVYKKRIDTLSYRTNEMKVKIAQLNKQLGRLILYKSDSVKIAKSLRDKNFNYVSRLDNAKLLMQDYILQEQAKVSRTERKKVDMSLGAYDIEKQEFELNMRDVYSEKFPFDYTGKVKIPPMQAEVIDRKTDDFTVSIDYINYPFIVNGVRTYPGAKKAYVFYKDQEFQNDGIFKVVDGFENVDGFLEWAMFADSIISGKLSPRNLDASFAMQKVKYKEESGPSWWTAPRIVRVIAFTLSAASLGTAIWQNSKADSKLKNVKEAFKEAEDPNVMFDDTYPERYKAYNKQKKELRDTENLRNILYISAGTFGVVGLVSFNF